MLNIAVEDILTSSSCSLTLHRPWNGGSSCFFFFFFSFYQGRPEVLWMFKSNRILPCQDNANVNNTSTPPDPSAGGGAILINCTYDWCVITLYVITNSCHDLLIFLFIFLIYTLSLTLLYSDLQRSCHQQYKPPLYVLKVNNKGTKS